MVSVPAQALRMLVVDDQPAIYECICAALIGQRGSGGCLDYVASGEEAELRLLDARRAGGGYDVAFVDYAMPGWDGAHTANRLWDIDPDLMVILSSGAPTGTAWANEEVISRPAQLLVLQKPFLIQELRQMVRICSAEHPARPRDLDTPHRVRFFAALEELLHSGSGRRHCLLKIRADRLDCRRDLHDASALRSCLQAIGAIFSDRLQDLDHHLFTLDLGEYAIILPDCAEVRAMQVGESLLEAGNAAGISLSIGIAEFEEGSAAAADIRQAALSARDQAQRAGGGSVRRASAEESGVFGILSEKRMVPEIERALAHRGFEFWAQPIVPVKPEDRSLPALELLLRMRDSDGILRGPEHFLLAAEHHGLMAKIDRHVVGAAIGMLAAGELLAGIDHLAVNVSAHLLNDPTGIAWLDAQLSGAPRACERLCLEITESAALNRVGSVGRFIRRMADRGVRFSLDDFGSGFASFDYLLELPVSFVKVDGSLVRGCAHDPRRIDLLRRIADLSHSWERQVIAEQVEDLATLRVVTTAGFDAVQGYYLARPVELALAAAQAAEAVQRLLEQRTGGVA